MRIAFSALLVVQACSRETEQRAAPGNSLTATRYQIVAKLDAVGEANSGSQERVIIAHLGEVEHCVKTHYIETSEAQARNMRFSFFVGSLGKIQDLSSETSGRQLLVACVTNAMNMWRMIPIQHGMAEFSVTFAW